MWMYAGLAIVGFVAGCTFFVCFRKDRKWEGREVILEAVTVETNTNRSAQDDKGPEKGS